MKKIKCNEFKQTVLNSNVPTVVLFSTEWSGSSIIVSGALNEIKNESNIKARFIELGHEECRKISGQYGITRVPSILIFKHGEVVEHLTGVPSKTTILKALKTI